MPRFKWADVIASSVVLAACAGFLFAAQAQSLEIANRVKCQGNLRMIGQALVLYANENRNAYPRTIMSADMDPRPVWGTPYEGTPSLGAADSTNPFAADDKPESKYRPAPNDVTAAIYLLMRTEEITVDAFVCPSSEAGRWDFGGAPHTALNWNNWAGIKGLREHLSYSMSNPYYSKKAIASGAKWDHDQSAEFAISGDMNPGTDDLLKLTQQSPREAIRKGNSANHGQDGQNILFNDGHVEFDADPFDGVMRDNVYTFGKSDGKSGGEGIIGAPVDVYDSVLLPTAKSLDAIDKDGVLIPLATVTPFTAEQATVTQKKLVGKYVQTRQGRETHLTVTDTALKAVSGPMTIEFKYELKGSVGDQVRLSLSAPQTGPTPTRIDFTHDGISVSKNAMLEGEWKKE